MSVGGVTRAEVLTLYRRILRLAQSWEARIPTAQVIEREYIQKEAKTRFRENKTVSDPKLINELFHEAEARIEIALHYKNPYPRPVNVLPKTLAQSHGHSPITSQDRLNKLN